MTEPRPTKHSVEDEYPRPDSPADESATTGHPGEPAPRRRRGLLGTLAALVLIALIGFVGGIAGFVVADEYLADGSAAAETDRDRDRSDDAYQPTNQEEHGQAPAPDDGEVLTPREVYRSVSPSVVHIDARIQRASSFFGIPTEPRESSGTGSGFVIDEDGHIVTNAHVVEDAQEINVSFGTDATNVPAKVVGLDRSSDIAVLKVDPDADQLDGYRLRPVPFGDSSKLKVGDPVLAIGNPFGLDRTLTTGVVSALQREIPSLNDFRITDVIQTDAAVNPGNSGGPLLNSRGRVIGVNSQIQSRSGQFAGVAFAVPSSKVRTVADQLIETGEVTYAWLGLAGGEITPELVEDMDLPVDEGVLVGTVTPGSPADRAGLQGGSQTGAGTQGRPAGGDIITRFDGEEITSMRQLADMVDQRKPGDKVDVEYVRDGKQRTTTVTLGERPDDVD